MMPQVTAGIPPAAVVYKIMNKHTIDNMDIGACYSVTCTSAATVTAEIDGATATLLSLPTGGSGAFFAPADSVCVETEGEFRVLPTEAPAPAIGAAGGGSAPVVIDPVPVEGSANAVASGGVYDAIAPLEDAAGLHDENTFTAAQSFHAPVTVGVPRVEAVRASTAIALSTADIRKEGTIADNDGHVVAIPVDSTRTEAQFMAMVEASELGLRVTLAGTTYRFYDFLSPDDQTGTLGNTRKLYVTGFGLTGQQTLSLTGGKDGEPETGQPVMLNGNVYIGHGPEGVKARCLFGITAAYLSKAGAITDNSTEHSGRSIELPEDPARTIDTLIAEINAQGAKLEVTAIKYNSKNIYLESTVEGSGPNGVVFTLTGCFSPYSDGRASIITQGSNIQGLDEGAASDWELRQNGYPVASRQTNNVYEGVQVFNNAVTLNGPTVLNGEVSASSSGLSAFTRNLFWMPADAYASCKSMDDVLAADPMISWRHAVYMHVTSARALSNGNDSVSKVLGNFGNTDRTLYIDFDIGNTSQVLNGTYCKAAFINLKNAYDKQLVYQMHVKFLYIHSAAASSSTGSMVKWSKGLEELCLNLPGYAGWGTDLDGNWDTLKKAVFMTTGACTSLTNLRGWQYPTRNFDLLTSLQMGDVFNVTAANNAFQGFTKVPSSAFPSEWPALSTGKDMFTRCELLAADKANAILDSLPDWSTEETPTEHIITFTGTAAATAWAADGADLSHVIAAEAKGWTVER